MTGFSKRKQAKLTERRERAKERDRVAIAAEKSKVRLPSFVLASLDTQTGS